jgi:hypothetical protein
MVHEVRKKYLRYAENPESHPKYTEEWNDFWLREYYKLNGQKAPSECDFVPQWIGHWKQRLEELEKQDLLEMRIKLRQKMHLPVEKAEMEEWKQILMESKVKIKENNPKVPLMLTSMPTVAVVEKPVIPISPPKPVVDLNELSIEVNNKLSKPTVVPATSTTDFDHDQEDLNNNIVEKDSQAGIKAKSNLVDQLSNNDIVLLFGNFQELSPNLQQDLIKLMQTIEERDPERYEELTHAKIDVLDEPDSEPEVPKSTTNTTNETAGKVEISDLTISSDNGMKESKKDVISDEDDYNLEQSDLIETVLEKAAVIEISDTEDVIDLTKD